MTNLFLSSNISTAQPVGRFSISIMLCLILLLHIERAGRRAGRERAHRTRHNELELASFPSSFPRSFRRFQLRHLGFHFRSSKRASHLEVPPSNKAGGAGRQGGRSTGRGQVVPPVALSLHQRPANEGGARTAQARKVARCQVKVPASRARCQVEPEDLSTDPIRDIFSALSLPESQPLPLPAQ